MLTRVPRDRELTKLYNDFYTPNWIDVLVPGLSLKTGPGQTPSLDIFSGTIRQYAFTDNHAGDEEAFFSIQLPHGYVEGSELKMHMHAAPDVNATAPNNKVQFKLEYTWANVDSTFAGGILTANYTVATSGEAKTHRIISFGSIPGANKTISSVLLARLYRTTQSDGVNDTYTGKVFFLSADAHVLVDSAGSDTETHK